jgi:hypothetical protein
MRKMSLLLILLFALSDLHAQNVGIGTTAPIAKLHIKGTQDSSQMIIDAYTHQSNTHPLIRLRDAAGHDLMAIHADDSTNIFMGVGAGSANNGLGKNNTFIGWQSGQASTGDQNTALGAFALQRNQAGTLNTAIGYLAAPYNTSGSSNVAIGFGALAYNAAGSYNTAIGQTAMYDNYGDIANYNTGIGFGALFRTSNSQYNTAVGYYAGGNFDNGYNNVFIGANTDVAGDGYYNVIAIGQGTICTNSSQVVMGNPATTSYRAYATWTNISDGRFKRNIREDVPGVAFITKLRPITYNLNATDLESFLHSNRTKTPATADKNDEKANTAFTKALAEKESQTISGFVAQDVEAAARSIGYNFSGIQAPRNDKDVYSLSYAEFVVPLVKAVQEQQAMIAELQKRNDLLEKRLAALESKK